MPVTYIFRKSVFPCMLALCAWTAVAGAAYGHSSAQGYGRVSMQGSITDTPCAIAMADRDQTIQLDVATIGELIHNGRGPLRTFSLNLVNCDLDADATSGAVKSHFRTTFDGPSDGELFSVSGATGIGVQIADAAGNVAIPGKALPDGAVVPGDQRLDYTLRLISNHHRLNAGEYHAIVRFKVDYF
ncbi:fimbrial protein [Siccibacter colletis]|uniref:fimbrial protein n=1 Tax=Siccibacter colletis TaxID=1505757 RepID=UPI0028BE9364|nr:fimbrial protein [Siccibacter colletis]WNN49334.1 fimbrial protein [Siccibacter colletis]